MCQPFVVLSATGVDFSTLPQSYKHIPGSQWIKSDVCVSQRIASNYTTYYRPTVQSKMQDFYLIPFYFSQGQHMDSLKYVEGLTILVNDKPCVIVQINDSYILCNPPPPPKRISLDNKLAVVTVK